MTLINTTVSGNTATGHIAYGGGIANYGGSELTLIDSTVSGNSSDRLGAPGGGGIGGSAELMLIRSTVSGNSTRQGSGGGIINSGSAR